MNRKMLEKLLGYFEKYLVLIIVGAFILGVIVARYSEGFTTWINTLVEGFVEGYGYVAPLAIFLILTPSLARMFTSQSMGRFGIYVIRWYAIRKLLACLWAAIFTVVIFHLPILPQKATSLGAAISQTFLALLKMMGTSPYFWAMYFSIAVASIAMKIPFLFRFLERGLSGIEIAGRYLMPLIPLFMFAIGSYIYGLPTHLEEQIELQKGTESLLEPFSVLGIPFNPKSPLGMIWIYVFGALLVGVACFLWHGALLFVTRFRVRQFSMRRYFTDYWIKVYPLLWATSSEAIATPLNLYLTKLFAPWVGRNVRRFVIGIGSYMNINGTLICVIVLGGVVFSILGIKISLVEWLFLIPVVFFISYGVPGIPGELVLFAGPMATLLNLPEAVSPVFLAIYIGLQLGLPDSFRTGNNSTDDFVCAILLNEVYQKKFVQEGVEEDAE